MLPLYQARIEDLRRGDLVKDCAARHHVALLTLDFLLRLGLSPGVKVLDLKARPVPRLRSERASRCVGQVGARGRVTDEGRC